MTMIDKLKELAGCEVRQISEGYFVSAHGEVWSCRRGEWRKLRPSVTNGYRSVKIIRRGDKFARIKIAKLVCEAFHGPAPAPGMLVRHLDGSRDNDIPGNLKWGTFSENALDAVRHGTSPSASNARKSAHTRRGTKSNFAVLDWPKVREIRLQRSRGVQCAEIAARFNVYRTTVSQICLGHTWVEPGMIVTKGMRIDGGKS